MTVWQRRWQSLRAVIVVIVDGGGGGIELTGPMAVSSTLAAVDGGGNDGVFTPLPLPWVAATKRAMARMARAMAKTSRVVGDGDVDSNGDSNEAVG